VETDDTLMARLRIAAALRAMANDRLWDSFWGEQDEVEATLRDLQDSLTSLEEVLASSGIEVNRAALFNAARGAVDRPMNMAFEMLIDDPLFKEIDRAHGREFAFVYNQAFTLFVAYWVSGFMRRFPDDDAVSRREVVENELAIAREGIATLGAVWLDEIEPSEALLGSAFIDSVRETAPVMQRGKELRAADFERIHEGLEPAVNAAIPGYQRIATDVKRSNRLRDELRNVRVGRPGWREYEDLMIKVVWFLLVPPMRRVIVQARSEGARTRRDAIVPNTAYSGVWETLRADYGSRLIVCEFKNERAPGAAAIDQLRRYLDRKSVGHFGILFIRSPPGEALVDARRIAFEERDHLILIVDDELLDRLLLARAWLGDISVPVEAEKVRFELTY
jgi:hypothetical protein